MTPEGRKIQAISPGGRPQGAPETPPQHENLGKLA